MGFAEDGVTLGFGCGIGAELFEMVNMKIIESISLSEKESEKLDESSGRVVYAPWSVENLKKQYDKNVKVVGYSGVVYTIDRNYNYINTGVVVNCGATSEGEPTKIWTSNEYNKGSTD